MAQESPLYLNVYLVFYLFNQEKIWINQTEIHDIPQKLIAHQISWVPQLSNDNIPFTVYEYVLMSRYSRRGPFQNPSKKDYDFTNSALQQCNLESLKNRKMNTLSGGEKQKAYLASAIAQNTPFLLLDEPGSFLDNKQWMELDQLLYDISHKKNGPGIISVTHDLNKVLCHPSANPQKILALKKGRVFYYGKNEDILLNKQLETLFNRENDPYQIIQHPLNQLPFIVPDIPKNSNND